MMDCCYWGCYNWDYKSDYLIDFYVQKFVFILNVHMVSFYQLIVDVAFDCYNLFIFQRDITYYKILAKKSSSLMMLLYHCLSISLDYHTFLSIFHCHIYFLHSCFFW